MSSGDASGAGRGPRRLGFPWFSHGLRTAFVEIDAKACAACGACVKACPGKALAMVTFFRHRHALAARAEACMGCLCCVKACPEKAIRPLGNAVGPGQDRDRPSLA